jgi:hypothetical protein
MGAACRLQINSITALAGTARNKFDGENNFISMLCSGKATAVARSGALKSIHFRQLRQVAREFFPHYKNDFIYEGFLQQAAAKPGGFCLNGFFASKLAAQSLRQCSSLDQLHGAVHPCPPSALTLNPQLSTIHIQMGALHYGDNLEILKRYVSWKTSGAIKARRA